MKTDCLAYTKELKNERNQIFKILLIDKTKPLVYLQYLA